MHIEIVRTSRQNSAVDFAAKTSSLYRLHRQKYSQGTITTRGSFSFITFYAIYTTINCQLFVKDHVFLKAVVLTTLVSPSLNP